MKKIIKLPKRIKAIADCVDDGAAVADIGTDHGYLPVYLTQAEIARRVIASDVSLGSLDSARRNAASYEVADKIEFVLARGLDGVNPRDADTIVIAGIGGENILGILSDAPWTLEMCNKGNLKLILQPQTKIDVLRGFLNEKGYIIQNEIPVLDRGREYTIIVC